MIPERVKIAFCSKSPIRISYKRFLIVNLKNEALKKRDVFSAYFRPNGPRLALRNT
ncbi:hypothetical protein ADICYQ_1831 [Cyclobacterium qasimii M12-11B]|uniref:Uncharacterized protein n=1 Tax=Cyclobacterium qasimii M12-11B TaxID=641524 RepID=S7WZ58_9BACT|nr:hypothetical protein ADICYQ_1831 [Cyclobacterium qasimii M12-11B]